MPVKAWTVKCISIWSLTATTNLSYGENLEEME